MARYRKRAVEVEAVQLSWATWNEVCEFLGDIINEDNPGRTIKAYNDTCGEPGPDYIAIDIHTLEGTMVAIHGDYIIKGVQGEFYPCRPDIFEATYEPVQE